MYSKIRWIVVVLVFASLQISACQQEKTIHSKIEPAHVEHIEGSELSRVTLTEKAIERIGLELAAVNEEDKKNNAHEREHGAVQPAQGKRQVVRPARMRLAATASDIRNRFVQNANIEGYACSRYSFRRSISPM